MSRELRPVFVILAGLVVFAGGAPAVASDHGDSPLGLSGPRVDGNLTDLHAFVVGTNLVLSLSTNPAIPPSATTYKFPSDLIFEINIDVDTAVDAADPLGDGGTILDPSQIEEDVTYRIRFKDDGSAKVTQIRRRGHVERESIDAAVRRARPGTTTVQSTLPQVAREDGPRTQPMIGSVFTGLRDDPFIRGPRQGRNVGAIVLEVPLAPLVAVHPTLLIWATSKIGGVEGQFQELDGRSLKSMFPENVAANAMHPRFHLAEMGMTPDVIIYDTSQPAAYPNGRALTDDVVDLVGDPRVLGNDTPFPSTNDRPFLDSFPYLAAPHPAP
jgi:hypothetical protein